MSITLSSADLTRLARATELLLSPLRYASADEWRSRVVRETKELLHADTGGFHLPVPGSELFHSDDFPPDVLARFPDVEPPALPGGGIVERCLELEVSTLERAYGRDMELFRRSPFHAEYTPQTKKHDLLFAMCPVNGEEGSLACLQLFHARPAGRRFREREVALLRLLLPAFRAGTAACLAAAAPGGGFGGALDGLDLAARVYDLEGRVLHQSTGLLSALREDAGAERVSHAMDRVAEAVRLAVGAGPAPHGFTAEVPTAVARYRVRGCLFWPSGPGPLVLVRLECLTRAIAPDEALREAFSLTPAELRGARLIARGMSNAEIAQELYNSPHTTNRHTESVFRKLGVRRRSEVGPKLRL